MKDKKQKILMAAKTVFEEHGFHNAKIAEIAKEAGVGKGTVYEYFESKHALFEEMIKLLMTIGFMRLEAQVTQVASPVEKLNVIARHESTIVQEHGKLFSLILVMLPQMSDDAKEAFFSVRMKQLALIESIVEEGQNSGMFKSFNKEHFALIFKGTMMQVNMHIACPPFHQEKDKKLKTDIYQFLIDSIMS